jgi:hypothetical protein
MVQFVVSANWLGIVVKLQANITNYLEIPHSEYDGIVTLVKGLEDFGGLIVGTLKTHWSGMGFGLLYGKVR